MSSKSSGGTTAKDEVEQYLKNNSGWHEVRPITNAIGYSNGHTRNVAKDLAENNPNVQGRKNPKKRVIGYVINGDLVVPGGDKTALESVIKRNTSSHPPLGGMTISELQKYLRNNVADGVVPLEKKLEFRWQ